MKRYIAILSAAAILLTMAGCSTASDKEGGAEYDGTNGTAGGSTGSYGYTDIGGTGSAAEDIAGSIGATVAGSKDPAGAYDAAVDGAAEAAPAAPIEGIGGIMDDDFGIGADDGVYDDWGEIGDEPGDEINFIPPQAGLLTGGEWCDNDHWSYWQDLYSTHEDWAGYKADWRIKSDCRIAVKVTGNGAPVEGAVVSCAMAQSKAVTDVHGMAYLFYPAIDGATEDITVTYGGVTKTLDGVIGSKSVEVDMGVSASKNIKLDLMIMCDTTGSMYDELAYLQVELQDIVERVIKENSNIPTRVSVNFYRDEGDEYVVRQFPFTTDLDAVAKAIQAQSSDGGGDYPEAVHTALDSAINGHDWDSDSIKIMFLVLDAPPHGEDAQVVGEINKLINQAAEKGIRIIPIASSGIDKSTEYILRTMAFMTGGTYTFLTNDSGIGGDHIEPTVGAYNVEKLSDMMVRIVGKYVNKNYTQPAVNEQQDVRIQKIVDRTVSEQLVTASALERFWSDDANEYYFPSIKSELVVVYYTDGSSEPIKAALEAGRASISDLDKYNISYYSYPRTDTQ